MTRRRIGILGREAVEAARQVQSRMTGGEITASHIVEQTAFGWTVHTCRPDEEKVDSQLIGRIAKLDALCQSPRGTNRMRLRRRQVDILADANRERVRRLSAMRNEARVLCQDDDDLGD